ncbi:chaperonin 10-like protein [Thelonectria olida]|uniref:Chaperonin 10-like protein n=1 Tax=Thelonectria olida TaxID=1576542 RepID=A0A9P8WDH3_9HYPO|nr:chaperonin 10-like protein [Thelonectria olida]
MTTHTIRKVVIQAYGDASNVSVVTAEIPPPAKNEVQVDVLYAGFSGADINMRLGSYPMQKTAPLTPGYCFVGRVSTNGDKASKFNKGDLVGALTVYDSEAQKINIAEKYLIAIPESVDMREALGLVLDWNTAYGLVHRGTNLVGKGKRVFIHCISGAVGYAVMTLCLLEGADVYGTASERNHADLRKLGVTPFTYTNKDWMAEMKKLGGAHVIYDPIGFESWDESWDTLITDEPSRLVGFGGNMNIIQGDTGKTRSQFPAQMKLLAKNGCLFTKRSTSFYYIDRDRDTFMPDLQALMQLLVSGKIEVPIKKVWDMENIREPHENWGKIPGMGSCLVRVDPNA